MLVKDRLLILRHMRYYTTDIIGKLLEEKREELSLLRQINVYKALNVSWDKIPDPILHKLSINHCITMNGVLQIICPSSVALSYVRQRRSLIEQSLEEFIVKNNISSIEIRIK